MSKATMTHTASSFVKRGEVNALPHDNKLLSLLEALLSPVALVLSLWSLAWHYEGELPPAYLLLSVIVFSLTFPGPSRLLMSRGAVLVDIVTGWLWVAFLLYFAGFATGYSREFSQKALWAWLWLAPLTDLLLTVLLRHGATLLVSLQGPKQRALIIGMNDQGLELARKLRTSRYSRIELTGFVDSRARERLGGCSEFPLLGDVEGLLQLVRNRHIHVIYMSLPMASQPRILHILDELKDTTASIYFVPDMFVTDLVQGRSSSVCGIPVISVCESPFRGVDGVLKRVSDFVFALLILLVISPAMVAIAAAVKVTSPGPVIFKQRRYGLDGEEILVYKFRSMTVTEDGPVVRQAQKNDQRITPLGAILRKTSLDELPQFINVLQGRMSIVGPRPHAVAHNELYRKLIKGYMVRHKVKPGITGWAQVNGYRGETASLDQMQGRIDYDLDYLRNWSLRLDIHIILKTVKLVLRDQKAY